MQLLYQLGRLTMATQKQIEANRRNAQRSTGPHPPQGKLTASQNALKPTPQILNMQNEPNLMRYQPKKRGAKKNEPNYEHKTGRKFIAEMHKINLFNKTQTTWQPHWYLR